MKICNKCNIEKELKSYDHHRSICRKCRNEKNMASYLSKQGNREKLKEYQKEYQKRHREKNHYYKVYCQCLWSLRNRIKTDVELRKHLEMLFSIEMNWDNYGIYWEIDHIISATKMAKLGYDINEINKLENLRPLKVKLNRERDKSV